MSADVFVPHQPFVHSFVSACANGCEMQLLTSSRVLACHHLEYLGSQWDGFCEILYLEMLTKHF